MKKKILKRDIVARIKNYLEYMEMIETGRNTTVIRQTTNSITIEIGDERFTIVVKKHTTN